MLTVGNNSSDSFYVHRTGYLKRRVARNSSGPLVLVADACECFIYINLISGSFMSILIGLFFIIFRLKVNAAS